MDLRDLFVGAVALTLGAMMIYAAIMNRGWCFQMKVARVVAESHGQSQARTFIGSVGALMVLLGIYTLFAPVIGAQFIQTSNDQRSGSVAFAEAD